MSLLPVMKKTTTEKKSEPTWEESWHFKKEFQTFLDPFVVGIFKLKKKNLIANNLFAKTVYGVYINAGEPCFSGISLSHFPFLATALTYSQGSVLTVLASLRRILQMSWVPWTVWSRRRGLACGLRLFALRRVTIAVSGILTNLSAAMHAWPMWINHSWRACGEEPLFPPVQSFSSCWSSPLEVHKLHLDARNIGPQL